MEGEGKVLLVNDLSAIDSDSQEFGIIYLAVIFEINTLKDLVDLLLGHLQHD